jgi:hypothetical protein
MAAAVAVIIKTAARVAISQREITSSAFHSSLVMRGITRKAFIHIEVLTIFI